METKPIFTVTTLRGALHGGTRCVGFFHEVETAIQAVEENHCDMCEEGYYHYAVVEQVSPGIYHFDGVEYWFRWHRTKGYQKCDKPENFKRVVCFGIG